MPKRQRKLKNPSKAKRGRRGASSRGYRKARSSISKVITGLNSINPFPPRMYRALTFTKNFLLSNSTPGVASTVSFRANGAQDPEVAVSTASCRYYGSLLGANDSTAPYRNYRVHASKILLEAWPRVATANQANVLISLIPRRTTISAPDDIDEMRNRPFSKTMAMTTSTSQSTRRIQNYVKMKTMLGVKDLNDSLATAAAWNDVPQTTEEVYWDVSIVDVEGAASGQCWVNVSIIYYMEFYTLNDVQD